MRVRAKLGSAALFSVIVATAATAGEICVIDGLGVPDGTVMAQIGAVDMSGGALYRQCVNGHLGAPFSVANLPVLPSATAGASGSAAGLSANPKPARPDFNPEPPPATSPAAGAGDIDAALRRLVSNEPGLLASALQRAQAEQRRVADEERSRKLAAMLPAIIGSGIAAGATEPEVTVVEWLDYGCSYCQQSEPGVRDLLAGDAKVRVVFKELPILGPNSTLAARVALAAREQGRYLEMHQALMDLKIGHGVELTDAMIERAAASLGVDLERLKRDMTSPQVDQTLSQTSAEAMALSIRSTPTFAIGNEVVPMALTAEGLAAKVAAVRAEGK